MSNPEIQYQQTLKFLYEQLPMFTRVGASAYKENLDNTILLCDALDNPQTKFKSIHIAGTNGKGSCSTMLATALQKSGYKTGLYTSPHITDFRERIKVNGVDIPKEFVVEFVNLHQTLIHRIQPSFFELTVALAFCYFAEQQVDIAVIEVGLGGLLDSTNIITPEVSVITNISNDHAYLLGNSIQEIAKQKAGIIKVQIPVVIGETQKEIEKIFITKAIMSQSPIFFADNRYQAVDVWNKDTRQYLKIIDKSEMKITVFCTDLLGAYQSKNIITVLQTINVLKSLGWQFLDNELENFFADTQKVIGFKGRYDVVHLQPMIIFDASHNEAGIQTLFKQIETLTFAQLHIIVGFVKDKELETILQFFPKNALYYFVEADMPRALPKNELKEIGAKQNLFGEDYQNVQTALTSAFKLASKQDLILVTGSFFILEQAYKFKELNLDEKIR